jgi:hypothetical protein
VKIFQKIFTEDKLQQRLQDSIANSFSVLEQLPQLDSNIVTDVNLIAGGDNEVVHKLNRPIQGWHIVRIDAAAIVYESSTVNVQPSAVVIFRTTVNCKVSILFF